MGRRIRGKWRKRCGAGCKRGEVDGSGLVTGCTEHELVTYLMF
jgi:hypothetical protein